nr:MAG TPA: hypothetical protein [Caudoviricetes sp.]
MPHRPHVLLCQISYHLRCNLNQTATTAHFRLPSCYG